MTASRSEEAARRAGTHVMRVWIMVLVLDSSLAACGGILFASRLFAVNQSSGDSDPLLVTGGRCSRPWSSTLWRGGGGMRSGAPEAGKAPDGRLPTDR